jgi:hypothetical protein
MQWTFEDDNEEGEAVGFFVFFFLKSIQFFLFFYS